MHRVDDDGFAAGGTYDGHVGNLFTDGDPSVPTRPTQLSSVFMNAVQEEIARLLEAAGVTLVKGTAQLRSVIANLTTVQTFVAKKIFVGGNNDKAIDATGGYGGDNGGGGPNGPGGDAVVGKGGDTPSGPGGSFSGGNGGKFTGGGGDDGGDGVQGYGGGGGLLQGRGGYFQGPAGSGGIAGGIGAQAKGGAGGGAGGGIGIEVQGGVDGGVYAKAIHAAHGDVHVDDGVINVDNPGSVIALEAKQTPTLVNSWVDVAGNYQTTKYWKDPFGVVHIEGGVKSGTSGTVAFTLPAGYRPSAYRYFVSRSFDVHSVTPGDYYAEFEVRTNGDVVVFFANETNCFLECSFRP